MASFIVPMTIQRASGAYTGPMVFIDNRSGTKVIQIDNIKIYGTVNLNEVNIYSLRGQPTVGTLATNTAITPVSEAVGAAAPNMGGCIVYQWSGASSGIGGITEDGTLLDLAVVGMGASLVELGRGIVIPAGKTLAIYARGSATAANVTCMTVHGRIED